MEEVCLHRQKVKREADEEYLSSLCTVKVSGMKNTTSKDMLELYFDNKKSGGGGVREVKGGVEEGVILITFENEKSKFEIF